MLEEETISSFLPLTEFENQPNNVSKDTSLSTNNTYVLLDLSDGKIKNMQGELLSNINVAAFEESLELESQPSEPECIMDENVSSLLDISDNTLVDVLGQMTTNEEDISGEFSNKRKGVYDETSSDSIKSASESDDNYYNQPADSDSDSELDLPQEKCQSSHNANKKKNERTRRSLNLSFSTNEQGRCSKDDMNMFVRPSKTNEKQTPKKLFCMFCGTFQSKFARHLENIHKNESDVKKFINLKKGSTERKQIIETIRKNSQFNFNTNTHLNDGELIVCRRPGRNLQRRAVDYSVCQSCKGFFTKNNIRHHAKRCFSYNGKKTRSLMVMGRKIIGRIHPDASNALRRNIFPVLREDDVIRCIRYDGLVILYGNRMCCKYRLPHQHDMIRANIRLLGRYLIALKNINGNILEFSNLFDPKYYDDAISAINVVGGFNESSHTYKAPSTAYNMGSLLKKLGKIYVNDCIKQKLSEKKENAEDFLKLLVEDLAVSVNKTVEETQTKNQRRKRVDMPSSDDIRKLHNYLKTKRAAAMKTIHVEYSERVWMTLAETTLITLQLFNRRRAGEIERIYIEDFQTYEKIDSKLLKTLEPSSKKLGENYVRVRIPTRSPVSCMTSHVKSIALWPS